jgi:hypothetical protein
VVIVVTIVEQLRLGVAELVRVSWEDRPTVRGQASRELPQPVGKTGIGWTFADAPAASKWFEKGSP